MALRTRVIGLNDSENNQYASNVGYRVDSEGNIIYLPVMGEYTSREKGGLHSYAIFLSKDFTLR